MEQQILQYLPIVTSALIVPLLGWVKRKVQKDVPILWLLMSVGMSVGASMGAGEALGIDPASIDLNATLTPLVTLIIHSLGKSKKKLMLGKANGA